MTIGLSSRTRKRPITRWLPAGLPLSAPPSGVGPAQDGLWQAAQATAHDLLARLAIVPLVLEARGLDVTPDMIEKLRRQGDEASVAVLATIYREEIAHVAAGRRWFGWECARRGLDPAPTYRDLVRRYH